MNGLYDGQYWNSDYCNRIIAMVYKLQSLSMCGYAPNDWCNTVNPILNY